MTVDSARRLLWSVIVMALVVGLLGSLAFFLFRDFLSRFPTQWG